MKTAIKWIFIVLAFLGTYGGGVFLIESHTPVGETITFIGGALLLVIISILVSRFFYWLFFDVDSFWGELLK